MATWLTYMAALLMAGATAFTFEASGTLAAITTSVANYISGVATLIFIPIVFVTFASGVASLRKDRLGGKTLTCTILWAVVTTLVLSACALAVTVFFPTTFPVSSSAGGDADSLLLSYRYMQDPLASITILSRYIVPVILLAWMFGAALKPSSDVIRPAYTVMNSWSEVMYRIQRTATYFGGFYVYVAGTAFFLNLWQEKTFVAAPDLLYTLLAAVLALLVVVLPLLYAIATGFSRNPYSLIIRSFASLLAGLVSSNIFATALINESVSRSNLGAQKRIASTSTPISILITRGGTAFVSIITTVTLLTTLGAELDLMTLLTLAGLLAVLSFLSSSCAGFEVYAVTLMALNYLKVDTYGAEVCIIALLPVLNGIAVMLDSLLSNMAASVASVASRTDAKIPAKDTI